MQLCAESPAVPSAQPGAHHQLLFCFEMQKSNSLVKYFHMLNEIAC